MRLTAGTVRRTPGAFGLIPGGCASFARLFCPHSRRYLPMPELDQRRESFRLPVKLHRPNIIYDITSHTLTTPSPYRSTLSFRNRARISDLDRATVCGGLPVGF